MSITEIFNQSEINLGLPPIILRDGTAMGYWAEKIASEYCGFKKIPTNARKIWQHGIYTSQFVTHPLLALAENASKSDRCFVAGDAQKNCLESCGYQDVHAIGMPIIYAPDKPNNCRIKNSLLCMPGHSLSYSAIKNKNINQFFEKFKKFAKCFDLICVCLHEADYKLLYEIFELKIENLYIVRGACDSDENSLPRMRQLFSIFENVITNARGSHVFYAAAFGARVSLVPPIREHTREEFSNTLLFQENPDFIDVAIKLNSEKYIGEEFGHLIGDPIYAKDATEWGRHCIGWDNKVSPSVMRDLFEWKFKYRVYNEVSHKLRTINAKIPQRIKKPFKKFINPQEYYKEIEIERISKIQAKSFEPIYILENIFYITNGKSFLSQYRDIVINDEYKFSHLGDSPKILDVGANIGLAVYSYYKRFGNARVIALESDIYALKCLRKNIENWGWHNLEIIPYPVTGDGRDICYIEDGCDIGKINDSLECWNQNTTKSVTLMPYLDEPVDFLKIDIEGSEYEILKSCESKLSMVRHLMVEYHSAWLAPQKLDKLINLITNAGFRIQIKPVTTAMQPIFFRPILNGFDLVIKVFGYRL